MSLNVCANRYICILHTFVPTAYRTVVHNWTYNSVLPMFCVWWIFRCNWLQYRPIDIAPIHLHTVAISEKNEMLYTNMIWAAWTYGAFYAHIVHNIGWIVQSRWFIVRKIVQHILKFHIFIGCRCIEINQMAQIFHLIEQPVDSVVVCFQSAANTKHQ